MKRKFLAETIRNFGAGLIVGSFLLRVAERISDITLVLVLLTGLSNVLFALILISEEE